MRNLILTFISIFLYCGAVYAGNADSIDSRNFRAYNVSGVQGLVDISDGDTAEVDNNGAVSVTLDSSSTGWSTSQVLSDNTYEGAAPGDCLVDTGSGIIQVINLYSNTADNYALIYDNTAASGTLLYDIVAGANGATGVTFSTAIPYSTGVYAYVYEEGDNLHITWKSND